MNENADGEAMTFLEHHLRRYTRRNLGAAKNTVSNLYHGPDLKVVEKSA